MMAMISVIDESVLKKRGTVIGNIPVIFMRRKEHRCVGRVRVIVCAGHDELSAGVLNPVDSIRVTCNESKENKDSREKGSCVA